MFFVATVPAARPSRVKGWSEGIDTAWDVFVYAPYEYTVVRELGEF